MMKTSKLLEHLESSPRVLGENPKISNPNANVDIASGALFSMLDSQIQHTIPLFRMGKGCWNWAQIVDERSVFRVVKACQFIVQSIPEEQTLRHIK